MGPEKIEVVRKGSFNIKPQSKTKCNLIKNEENDSINTHKTNWFRKKRPMKPCLWSSGKYAMFVCQSCSYAYECNQKCFYFMYILLLKR